MSSFRIKGSTLASCRLVANKCRSILGAVCRGRPSFVVNRMNSVRSRSVLTTPASRQTERHTPRRSTRVRGRCSLCSRLATRESTSHSSCFAVNVQSTGGFVQVNLRRRNTVPVQRTPTAILSTSTSSGTSGISRSLRVFTCQPSRALLRIRSTPASKSRSSGSRRWTISPGQVR